MKNRSSFDVMIHLIRMMQSLTLYMILAVILGVLGFLMAISITVIGGYLLVSILETAPLDALVPLFIAIGVFAILRGFLRYGEQTCNHYIAFKLLALIRDRMFTALRKLAPAKLEGKDRGNLISIITADIELLEVFYAHTVSPICIAILVSIIMTGFLAQYHILLGLLAIIAYLTIGVFIPVIMSSKTKALGAEYRKNFGDLNSFFLDSKRGVKEIIQYGHGEHRLNEIIHRTDEMAKIDFILKKNTTHSTGVIGLSIMTFSILMLFLSSQLYLADVIGIDGVIISTITIFSSFGAVVAVANLGTGLTQTIAAGNRVLDILQDTPKVAEVNHGIDIDFQEMSLENVDFSYDKEEILKNFNVTISKGKIIGIVGKSGSGKSTMLKLMMRFWDIDSGQISMNNHSLTDINTQNLRSNQSFVTQQTQLFHDTIENNILLARRTANHEDIETACKKASIHDFITSLPQGYDTIIGELGETLSGGERQRIGLARAFLHNAPLILLDEPTSNIDSLNEAIILKALKEDSDRTIVLVSHRISTMQIADIIYSVENGRNS